METFQRVFQISISREILVRLFYEKILKVVHQLHIDPPAFQLCFILSIILPDTFEICLLFQICGGITVIRIETWFSINNLSLR